jgi:hypothetical protein
MSNLLAIKGKDVVTTVFSSALRMLIMQRVVMMIQKRALCCGGEVIPFASLSLKTSLDACDTIGCVQVCILSMKRVSVGLVGHCFLIAVDLINKEDVSYSKLIKNNTRRHSSRPVLSPKNAAQVPCTLSPLE